MATDKKSFLLYTDLIHTVDKLNNEEAGELFKHILNYVNDLNPEPNNLLIEIAFEPIKQSLKRDLKRYENVCNRNKINGLKGGRPKNPKEPTGLIRNPKKPKKPDSDNDSDNDSVKEIYREFDHLKITKEDNKKLKDLFYTQYQINDIYDRIENFKDNKKYKSLYLTARNWLKKEQPQGTKVTGTNQHGVKFTN